MSTQPLNKAMKILAVIKAGGATTESLMTAADVNKAGLASQLSYLNTRGLNIAEIDESKAEFPMKGEDGVYRMGTLDEYSAKRAAGTGIGKKTLTVEELLEFAQKREDKASAAATKATERLENDPNDTVLNIRADIAQAQLRLATAMLHAVEQGNYKYEHATVKDGE